VLQKKDTVLRENDQVDGGDLPALTTREKRSGVIRHAL